MKKQVQKSIVEQAPVANSQQQRNLFMSVETFNQEGRSVGKRVVDLYHYGTRNWINQHTWWAMNNHCEVEIKRLSDEAAAAYVNEGMTKLQEKFNGPAPQTEVQAA